MGTPDFSVPVLDALVEAGHDVAAVYTQPPRAGWARHEVEAVAGPEAGPRRLGFKCGIQAR